MITVDSEMSAFSDTPTRQTARPLHANTQKEGTRQETVTDIGTTDGLDKEDTVPADGATNPPDEDPKTEEPGQTPYRDKKIKFEKRAGIQREWMRRKRVAHPNKDKV